MKVVMQEFDRWSKFTTTENTDSLAWSYSANIPNSKQPVIQSLFYYIYVGKCVQKARFSFKKD